MLPLSLLFTAMYLSCGMFVVGFVFSQPASQTHIDKMMKHASIPDEAQSTFKTILTILFVLFWPAMISGFLNNKD